MQFLYDILKGEANYKSLLDAVKKNELPLAASGLSNIHKAVLASALNTHLNKKILLILDDEASANTVTEDLLSFGINARNLPLKALQNGLIIDIAAAEILTERGIDVGLKDIGNAVKGTEEHFLCDHNHILTNGITAYHITIKDSAEILSDMETDQGVVPLSYRYENTDGRRFLVLNINTRSSADNILKHYARSRQYAEQIQWLSGRKLPAYVYGHPALYMQCKKDKDSLAVGLWNFFADTAIEPMVELAESYFEIEFLNCHGKLSGNKVYLTDIPPFGFAGFTVK